MGKISLFNRLALALAGVLALGSCNRAEYAMLPRTASYLGTKSVAVAPRPAAVRPQAAAPVATAPTVVATAPTVAASTSPAAKSEIPTPRLAPIATTPAPAAAAPAEAVATAPQPKLSLMQRLVLSKVTKKLDKLAAKSPRLKQRDATAGTQAVDAKLRQILVIGAIGLAIELLAIILSSGFVYVLGSIVFLVALVLLILYLIDKA